MLKCKKNEITIYTFYKMCKIMSLEQLYEKQLEMIKRSREQRNECLIDYLKEVAKNHLSKSKNEISYHHFPYYCWIQRIKPELQKDMILSIFNNHPNLSEERKYIDVETCKNFYEDDRVRVQTKM